MSLRTICQKVSAKTGLSFDRDSGITAGFYNGYHIALVANANVLQLTVSVSTGVGQKPEKATLKQAHKNYKKTLGQMTLQGYRASFVVPGTLTEKGRIEKCVAGIQNLTDFLKENGLRDCSELSGRPDESSCYFVNGGLRFLTQDEYDAERSRAQSSFDETNAKRGNPIAGIVGALLGSLVGVALMVLIGQLGYVSAWSGIVMGVCVVKGYELLSGKFDMVGMVISLVVMIGMVYLGNQLDWAITIARAYEANIFDAFPVVNYVVRENDALPVYYRNLVLYYIFTLLGAVPTLIGAMQHQKLLGVSYPIGAEAHEETIYVTPDDTGSTTF